MVPRILLTGRPGVGKTTVVRRVIELGIPLAGGFLTEEVREGGRRLGFLVKDLHSGTEGVLAHVDRKGSPRVGKYGVDVASFERIGVAAVREALGRAGCLVVDEIGKMELCSRAFQRVVDEALASEGALLATLPIYRHPFLDELRARGDVRLITVTVSSRDDLPHQVAEWLGAVPGGRL